VRARVRADGLNGFEIPKSVTLTAEPFSVENGCLTPTLKMKRKETRDKYKPQIAAMYTALKANEKN
jgi:long-chain acyl-CoA synthetase